jgi:hypothetical protein
LRDPIGTRPLLRRALLVAVAFLLAGCGGSEGEEAEQATGTRAGATTGERDTPSKRQFIAQGDAICADVQVDAADLARRAQELQAESDELPRQEFLARAADFWADQIRLAEGFLERLEGLGVPSGDEPQVEEFLQSIEDGIATAQEIQNTLSGGEDVSQALVAEYGQTVARGNTLARDYGFRVCGRTSPSADAGSSAFGWRT